MRAFPFIRLLTCLLLSTTVMHAQLAVGRDTLTVIENGKVLKMPWAGGLNSCMLSSIDLNQDGRQDIVAFDKVNFFGFGILRCFINNGIAGQASYTYDASYNPKFPGVQYWALFNDYNNDGKADLFTYSPSGGTTVYRNTSSGGNLSFQLAKSLLRSNTTPSSTPSYGTIFANSISGPGLSDIDNDGDLDILVFSALGYQIEYHRNMSKESGWNADSLVFQLEESTWGDLSENNCVVSLNQFITPQHPYNESNSNKAYHAGACLMCFDRDGDNDKDLIIGDIYCAVANYCENGGTTANAHITDTTKIYPNYPNKANTQVIRMNSFPCTYYLDVDNDGKKDLIASPNTVSSENYTSVWLYKNMATANVADFQFVKKNFLQDEMIELGEGAYPVLFDADADGLQDLIVGNTGYYNGTPKPMLAYYRNTGTLAQPSFSLITRDFFNLSAQAVTYTISGMVPTFGDVDGDGDADLLIADYYGRTHLAQNSAGAGNPCNFSSFLPYHYTLTPAPSAAYPQLIDVNRDGLLDLLVGTRNGKLSFYQNTGTASAANFSLVSSSFGGVNVKGDPAKYSTDGSCAPFLYDDGGSYKLLCGSVSGNIYFYDNIDGNLTGNFNRIDSAINQINNGPQSAVQFVDINGDGKRDLIAGNYAGGLSFFSSKNTIGINELAAAAEQLIVYPNPATDRINIRSTNKFSVSLEATLTDVTGKVLMSTKGSNTLSLDCSQLARGIYFVRVTITADGTKQAIVKKIILH